MLEIRVAELDSHRTVVGDLFVKCGTALAGAASDRFARAAHTQRSNATTTNSSSSSQVCGVLRRCSSVAEAPLDSLSRLWNRSRLCTEVHRIDLDCFRQRAHEYDATVARCVHLDRFCSSADWVLSAHHALMPRREELVYCDNDAWIALARGRDVRGFTYLEPLEASWALACPIVGAEPAMLLEVCRSHRWDVLLLAGILDGTQTQARILSALIGRFEVRRGDATVRHVADLSDGLDAYLSRRTRNFRRSLARARRRAADAGIEIEIADDADPEAAYARVLDIERRTWKGRAGVGIDAGGMREFYRLVVGRLASRGALRLRFARLGDHDIAYILGGLFAGAYRGLQFGYDANRADIGLGNLCQYHQMATLCAEGIGTYDLGTTGGAYKRRWSDRTVESSTFVIINA